MVSSTNSPKEAHEMLTNRIRSTVIALAAAGSLAAVAAPAGAQQAQQMPPGKSCSIVFAGSGQSLEYADGTGFSVKAADGKTHTYTCRNGKWEETVGLVRGTKALNGAVSKVGGELAVR
jgi:hypothetical protein